jgi:hypothetical protein
MAAIVVQGRQLGYCPVQNMLTDRPLSGVAQYVAQVVLVIHEDTPAYPKGVVRDWQLVADNG